MEEVLGCALWTVVKVMMRMVRRLCKWMTKTPREEGCWEREWNAGLQLTGGEHSRGRGKERVCRK